MSTDFWVGFLAGVIASFFLSFILAMALMTIVQHLAQRQTMAEERVWTGHDDDFYGSRTLHGDEQDAA